LNNLVEQRQNENIRFERLRNDDSRIHLDRTVVESLEASLLKSIEGEVRFDKGTRALYATDGSNYRQAPIGVVLPKTIQDVENAVRIAREHQAPILSRGCGTSLAGQCCNTAVVIDFSKYLRNVLRIDAENKLGRVQPGCVLDHFTISTGCERSSTSMDTILLHMDTWARDASIAEYNSISIPYRASKNTRVSCGRRLTLLLSQAALLPANTVMGRRGSILVSDVWSGIDGGV
jgi:FAD binding domain